VTTEPLFEEWAALHMRHLLRTAWLLTGNTVQAEDLVQTALLRCWTRWSTISRVDDVWAYVHRVLTRTYLGSQRRRWRHETPVADVPDAAGYAPTLPCDSAALTTALRRLPPRQRAVIVLRFAEDLSEAQTATQLGISIGTVKSQASRALRSLRQDTQLLREMDAS
jgi:RNA polymerase sigma-70 factor (sigma-E family)